MTRQQVVDPQRRHAVEVTGLEGRIELLVGRLDRRDRRCHVMTRPWPTPRPPVPRRRCHVHRGRGHTRLQPLPPGRDSASVASSRSSTGRGAVLVGQQLAEEALARGTDQQGVARAPPTPARSRSSCPVVLRPPWRSPDRGRARSGRPRRRPRQRRLRPLASSSHDLDARRHAGSAACRCMSRAVSTPVHENHRHAGLRHEREASRGRPDRPRRRSPGPRPASTAARATSARIVSMLTTTPSDARPRPPGRRAAARRPRPIALGSRTGGLTADVDEVGTERAPAAAHARRRGRVEELSTVGEGVGSHVQDRHHQRAVDAPRGPAGRSAGRRGVSTLEPRGPARARRQRESRMRLIASARVAVSRS